MLRIAAHKSDLAMAQRQQMLGHGARRRPVVHPDARRARGVGARRDADDGHVMPLEDRDQFVAVADRRRQDRAAQPQPLQAFLQPFAPVGTVERHRLDHQMPAQRPCPPQCAQQHVIGIAAPRIVEE